MTGSTDTARLRDFEEFQNACSHAGTIEQLSSIIDAVVRQFGFRWFALVHDGALEQHLPKRLMITNYPSAWVEEIVGAKLYVDDPVHPASIRSAIGLRWERITDMMAPSPKQLSVLERGRDHGLVSGFTVPFRIPFEPWAFFSVARGTEQPFSYSETMTAQLVAGIAFERGRELVSEEARIPAVSLSPRQTDCLKLIAEGKTDWEIGKILSLSPHTIHEYVEDSRRRYGVKTRSQLVLAATRDGYIKLNYLA
jgi:DNA-binding CsgD family transcriptional regulator